MFVRLRWFIYGASMTLALTALVVSKARAMREQLDRQGVTRVTVNVAADGLEFVGRRLQRSALRVAEDGGEQEVG